MNERRLWGFLLALGLMHGVLDAMSGYASVLLVSLPSVVRLATIMIIYNGIAFALQPLFGWIVDYTYKVWPATIGGAVLLMGGFFLLTSFPLLGFGMMAVGSGLFHVSAGRLAGLARPDKVMPSSLFTAPGIVGLALGIAGGLNSIPLVFILGLLWSLASLALFATYQVNVSSEGDHKKETNRGSGRWMILGIGLLLSGIAVRSSAWVLVGKMVPFHARWIISLGVAAGMGKLLGGAIADRWGRGMVLVGMTFCAVLSLLVHSLPFVVFAVVFFQASTPVLLAMLTQRFPKRAAFMAGLVLGLSLTIGAVVATIISRTSVTDLMLVCLCLIVATMSFAWGRRFLVLRF